MTLASAQYDQINLPILTITGQYDGDQAGADGVLPPAHAVEIPPNRTITLIIGPWDHPGTRTPRRSLAG